MPELPDILLYQGALKDRVVAQPLRDMRVLNPFLLRTVKPTTDVINRRIVSVKRIGKRIAFVFDQGAVMVVHLMITGRLHWFDREPRANKTTLAVWQFPSGWLTLTEQGSKRRASLHIFDNWIQAQALSRGGLDVRQLTLDAFAERLKQQNRSLKRALTDPRIFDGIGNAYSDEILFAAKLPPHKRTHSMTDQEIERLFQAANATLSTWITRMQSETGTDFPEKVTAFRAEMAVHGKYGQPCRECNAPVQRIRYAENECNYCPDCQNKGVLLADRGLSRLLKGDWPKRWEDLDN
ncbi:MAG: formamidopyrimidine-DNA glycosylase [Acidobacteria bacterium]|nr:formamidopyrimidine-DNA glycosylase [Acidobacteriota bacterium]